MARSATLNPASMPFFPGALRGSDDESGVGRAIVQHVFHDRTSVSLHSTSSSDHRSIRSSPSPPRGPEESRYQPSPVHRDANSPTFRHNDASKSYPAIETNPIREASVLGTMGTLLERENSPSLAEPDTIDAGTHTPGSSFSSLQHMHERLSPPPNLAGMSGPATVMGVAYTSSSPVSSQNSSTRFTPAIVDLQSQSFETQLKASPMMHDILDRLVRCEYTTREIQSDLGDINRKVNLLVERALGVNNSQPEFKDPFDTSSNSSNVIKHRPSVGNIAPNQAANTDDISSISQRLNTLTSSVGQLLALQTQQLQHQQTTISDGRNNSVVSLNPPQLDLAPNQVMPPQGVGNAPMLGHSLPNRPDLRLRHPNPPLRTWSAGTLDLPMRPSEQGIGRQEAILRDKRRSVSGLLRRDSSGMLESQGDNWAGGNSRESGPVISKWEQLSLAPDLLRSLGKFGVGPPNKIQQRALPFLLRGSDIIAQAPPTQERIAAYVIPAIQVAVLNITHRPPNRGPIVIMISTTVDQATQAQRMIRDLGGPIGVRSALGVGTTTSGNDLAQEIRLLQQNLPHIICGTPQKLHALFTTSGGLLGSEVRFLVLDEVDQLIARNLHEFVFSIVKLLPPPRSRPLSSTSHAVASPGATQTTFTSPFEPGNPVISPFQNSGRRFSTALSNTSENSSPSPIQPIERQTALFSNTVPQDVLNLASAIQLREPVRVLVRRDGNVANPETNQGSRGLRQFYLYLAFTAGGRSDPLATTASGLGIIGSGRSASNAETNQAREWKLDALADIFEDVEVNQAIVHAGGINALESVVYKLASRGLEAIPLHGDMNSGTKLAALNKFRTPASTTMRQSSPKVLVVYDIQVKSPEVPHVPLVINYDLPKAVEEYSHRVAPAMASSYSRAGVVVNFVTATGGDVEMLRSIECFYKIKCPEVPISLRDIV